MKNVTYILKCNDNSLYTGWTNDITHRLKMHNEGKGAKYTRGRGPVELSLPRRIRNKARGYEQGS